MSSAVTALTALQPPKLVPSDEAADLHAVVRAWMRVYEVRDIVEIDLGPPGGNH